MKLEDSDAWGRSMPSSLYAISNRRPGHALCSRDFEAESASRCGEKVHHSHCTYVNPARLGCTDDASQMHEWKQELLPEELGWPLNSKKAPEPVRDGGGGTGV